MFDCLYRLDEENHRINFSKCDFLKQETDWLAYIFTQKGIMSEESKTSVILPLKAPKILIQFPSFPGSKQYISKSNPNLAQISHPLQPLLRKSVKSVWRDIHEICLLEIKKCIAIATEN